MIINFICWARLVNRLATVTSYEWPLPPAGRRHLVCTLPLGRSRSAGRVPTPSRRANRCHLRGRRRVGPRRPRRLVGTRVHISAVLDAGATHGRPVCVLCDTARPAGGRCVGVCYLHSLTRCCADVLDSLLLRRIKGNVRYFTVVANAKCS